MRIVCTQCASMGRTQMPSMHIALYVACISCHVRCMQPGGTLLGEGEETTFVACQLHKLLPTLLAHQLRHAYALLALSLLEGTAGCRAAVYSVAVMLNMLCFAGCGSSSFWLASSCVSGVMLWLIRCIVHMCITPGSCGVARVVARVRHRAVLFHARGLHEDEAWHTVSLLTTIQIGIVLMASRL
jgi:hypothetical protein